MGSKKITARIARLEAMQAERVALANEAKARLDALIADRQREIDNLKAQRDQAPVGLRSVS